MKYLIPAVISFIICLNFHNAFADFVIEYEVLYPKAIEDYPSLKADLPSLVIISSNDRYVMMRMEIGGRISPGHLLWDMAKDLSYNCMEVGGRKLAKLEAGEEGEMGSESILLDGEKTILGYRCHQYLIIDGLDSSTAYATNALGDGFTMGYGNMEGYLMEFELPISGVGNLILTATNIMELELPDEVFSLDGYEIVKSSKKKQKEDQASIENPMLGRKCPKFKTKTLEGESFSTKEGSGKILVLNFWFTTCPPCIKEMPILNSLYDKYSGDPDIEFMSVATDRKAQILNFLEKTSFSYPIIDEGQFISEKFRVNSYPTNVVIGKDGSIKLFEIGFHADIAIKIEEAIRAER